MKKSALSFVGLCLLSTASQAAIKDCESLKQEIDAKLQARRRGAIAGQQRIDVVGPVVARLGHDRQVGRIGTTVRRRARRPVRPGAGEAVGGDAANKVIMDDDGTIYDDAVCALGDKKAEPGW